LKRFGDLVQERLTGDARALEHCRLRREKSRERRIAPLTMNLLWARMVERGGIAPAQRAGVARRPIRG